jgi:phage-related protein
MVPAATYSIAYFNPAVRAGIESWPTGLKVRYRALTLRMVEHGANLGMPHTRAMGGGLFELRVKGAEGIGRAFYCALVGRRIVILHGMVKKSDKTPVNDLRIARIRLNEVLRHGA